MGLSGIGSGGQMPLSMAVLSSAMEKDEQAVANLLLDMQNGAAAPAVQSGRMDIRV